MKDYTATEALELLLSDFRERRKTFSAICDYDDSMMQMRRKYRQQIENIKDPLKLVAENLFEISDQTFFLFQVIEWKIDYLAEALLHSIQYRNPLSLAINARSLVEHIATIALVGSKIYQLEEALRGQQSETTIKKELEKGKNFLNQAYYGKSPKVAGEKEVRSIHINDALKILSKEIKDIEEKYDFLCEYVHPNYGSNLLVSTGILASVMLQ